MGKIQRLDVGELATHAFPWGWAGGLHVGKSDVRCTAKLMGLKKLKKIYFFAGWVE